MAKKYFYKCVVPKNRLGPGFVELGYMAPDQRKERQDPMKPLVLHSIRIYSSAGTDARGRPFRPNYIATDKPVGRLYTEEILKKVSRPAFDPQTGRRTGRVYKKKYTTIKLELVPDEEVDSYVRDNAFYLPWTEALFDNGDKNIDKKDGAVKIDLPETARRMDKNALTDFGDEPEERVPEEGEPVVAAKNGKVAK